MTVRRLVLGSEIRLDDIRWRSSADALRTGPRREVEIEMRGLGGEKPRRAVPITWKGGGSALSSLWRRMNGGPSPVVVAGEGVLKSWWWWWLWWWWWRFFVAYAPPR